MPLFFTSLYGNGFLVGLYVLFLVEFALVWLGWSSLRAHAVAPVNSPTPPGGESG